MAAAKQSVALTEEQVQLIARAIADPRRYEILKKLGTCCGASGTGSRVSFPATAGTQYIVAVDGKSSDLGDVTLAFPPANDDFAAPRAQTARAPRPKMRYARRSVLRDRATGRPARRGTPRSTAPLVGRRQAQPEALRRGSCRAPTASSLPSRRIGRKPEPAAGHLIAVERCPRPVRPGSHDGRADGQGRPFARETPAKRAMTGPADRRTAPGRRAAFPGRRERPAHGRLPRRAVRPHRRGTNRMGERP